MDLLGVLLTSASVSVLITAIFSFFGSWVEEKRRHRRWLRERQTEIYVGILRQLSFAISAVQEQGKLRSEIDNANDTPAAQLTPPRAKQIKEDLESLKMRISNAAEVLQDIEPEAMLFLPKRVNRAIDESLSLNEGLVNSKLSEARLQILAEMRAHLDVHQTTSVAIVQQLSSRGTGVTGLIGLDFVTVGSVAGLAALVSVLTSIAFRGGAKPE